MPPIVIMGAMLAVTAAGTAMSAIAANRAGKVAGDTAIVNSQLRAKELIAQAQMAEREAQQALFAADAERDATKWEVDRQQEQARAFQAQQRVDVAGSGLEATGSPLLVMAETARQLELDKLAIEHSGETRALQAIDDAKVLRYQAQALRDGVPLELSLGRYVARAHRQQGKLGATSSIIGGAAEMGRQYMRFR